MIQDPNKGKKTSSIIIITHSSKDVYLKKILNEINKKNYIRKKPKLIRIDDV
jgi:tryptophan 2,3-dioxygenase